MKKEVKILVEGKEESFELEGITAGERNSFLKQCTVKKVMGGVLVEDIDNFKLADLLLRKTIKKAPFEVTADNLGKLSPGQYDLLLTVAKSLMGLSEDEEKNLEQQ